MVEYETISRLLYTAQSIVLITQGILLVGLGRDLIKLGRCLTKGQINTTNNFKYLTHHHHFESDSKLEKLTKN